uniref:AlNc14C4G565 protein n=1 Tax=Albugo laibachii Nc14 TaxID=890382 RepID=F0W0C2_9STRA|nr:AlNc14C4G565 [Albugo laibachii Nc14]|eukprot:CCA14494.1 AlNc14C4G565 [Albugo laibachii Nc14]
MLACRASVSCHLAASKGKINLHKLNTRWHFTRNAWCIEVLPVKENSIRRVTSLHKDNMNEHHSCDRHYHCTCSITLTPLPSHNFSHSYVYTRDLLIFIDSKQKIHRNS